MELWQLKQLKNDLIAGPEACGYDSGTWTGPPVADHVRYGVSYTDNSMRENAQDGIRMQKV